MPVTIHLVRHAQGFHNLSRENEELSDPLLTDLGKQQCANLKATFPHHDKLTRLIASPLRRTLDTCLLSFASKDAADIGKYPKVIAVPELQEVSDAPCDTGSDPAIINQEFKDFADTSRLHEGWNTVPEWIDLEYKLAAVQERGRKARLALKELTQDLGDNDHVGVVSHGAFLHFLTQDYHGVQPRRATAWENTDYRTYQFAESGLLVETDESWQRRRGDEPRPTPQDQEKLKEVYYSQLVEYVRAPGH